MFEKSTSIWGAKPPERVLIKNKTFILSIGTKKEKRTKIIVDGELINDVQNALEIYANSSKNNLYNIDIENS